MRARNEYILSLEATNAFVKKYFDQDVYDILEVSYHRMPFQPLATGANQSEFDTKLSQNPKPLNPEKFVEFFRSLEHFMNLEYFAVV